MPSSAIRPAPWFLTTGEYSATITDANGVVVAVVPASEEGSLSATELATARAIAGLPSAVESLRVVAQTAVGVVPSVARGTDQALAQEALERMGVEA